MHHKLNSIKSLLLFFLLSFVSVSLLNAQTVTKSVINISTGGDGSTALPGNILSYTIVTRNTDSVNYTASKLYDNIPAGTSYVPSSTVLNGQAISDAGGNMPYSGGGSYIQSPTYGTGILAPNVPATLTFRVVVSGSGLTITNSATVETTRGSVAQVAISNTVTTAVLPDPACGIVYQVTGSTPTDASGMYKYFRTLNTATGVGGSVIFNGATGVFYEGNTITRVTPSNALTTVTATAYDRNTNRLYFVNNVAGPAPISYVDLNTSPAVARVFTGYNLQSNTANGYNINRMTIGTDGYGYALTSNSLNLIRFSFNADNIPTITQLGTLFNDSNNGNKDVLSEVGGDIFSDAAGKLFLVSAAGNVYRINPATRVATYLGAISPGVGIIQSVAANAAGDVFVGGAFNNVYKVDMATFTATSITGGSTTNIYTSGDFASCGTPSYSATLAATLSYTNLTTGGINVNTGDIIQYTLLVGNTGTINAAQALIIDNIPAGLSYFPGSTRLNGVAVADVNGTMPYAANGGAFINSPGATAGIVKPGSQAVISFRAIVTGADSIICNQAYGSYVNGSGNGAVVTSNATCFTPGATDSLISSRLVTTNSTAANNTLRVFPNPFRDQLNLQVKLNTAQTVQIRLVDFYGRTVFTSKEKAGAGVSLLQLTVPANLSKGMYLVEVLNGNSRLLQQKLTKQ